MRNFALVKGKYLGTLSATSGRLSISSSMSGLDEIMLVIAGIRSLHHGAGTRIFNCFWPSSTIESAWGQELPDLDPSDRNLLFT
jgi:hypothetical protein